MFLFLLGVFGQVTPGILLLWIWIVKQFPQISGFKCHNDVKTLLGRQNRISTFHPTLSSVPRPSSAWADPFRAGYRFTNAETAGHQPVQGAESHRK
jgi:hypothetical protein